MNVLTDYHHGNLYYAQHLLFEKRLKMELYRPIGWDWFWMGYWRVAEPYGNAKDTINQFLGAEKSEWNPLKNLNGGFELKDGVYYVYDHENKFTHKAITYKQFKKMQFDFIVPTHPEHDWTGLMKYQKGAKYIVQLGNEGQETDADNVLCSTADFKPVEGQRVVKYHQEFDLTEYTYEPPTNEKKIKSFVISLPEPELYLAYKEALPEFDFKAHGVGSPDGTVHGPLIPQLMRESAFGWHIKPADGYGHVIHKWMASGRPVITRGSYYSGKMADALLMDGFTCIDLDKGTFEENIKRIRFYSRPDRLERMCKHARDRFVEVVDFEREAREVRQFLELSNVYDSE